MTEYRIKGTLTFEEYLECHQVLAAKRRLWTRSIVTVYGGGMLLYGTLASSAKPGWALAVFGALFVLYGTVVSPVQFRYRVMRNWKRYPKIKKEFEISVSAAGVESKDDKGNPSHSNWDSFLRFRESPSLFLLYLSPLLPLCLPKRLVPDDDLPGLRELLSSSVRAEGAGGP